MKSMSASTILPSLRSGRIALLGVALAAGGCSSEGGGDLTAMFNIASSMVHPQVTSVSLQQAASIPHATAGLRVGEGSEILTVLAIFHPGELWVAGTKLSVVTRSGRIVQSVGFEHDLTKLNPDVGSDFSPSDLALGKPAQSRWLVDFGDLGVYAAAIECNAQPVRRERVTILGKAIEAERVEERCNSPSLAWSFTNIYWISPTSGLMWKSIQNIHPKLDPITMELLRPPAYQD